jgi:hypothetical protein
MGDARSLGDRAIRAHRLRNEIVATKVANRLVNRLGPSVAFDLTEEEGASLGQVIGAFLVAERLLDLGKLWQEIEEDRLPEAVRIELFSIAAASVSAHLSDIIRAAGGENRVEALCKLLEPGVRKISTAAGKLIRSEVRNEAAADAEPDNVDRTWIPIGPSVVLTGAGGGRPRVSGRATDVRVSPDGRRVYAATADGGVWFSGDGGTTWAPLGGWAVTATPASVVGTSNVCACGCLFVRFDAAGDEVLVGTGERVPLVERPHHSGYNAGVGVLRAVNPSAADPFAQVWQVEATNLSGLGIFRIAVDPTTPTSFHRGHVEWTVDAHWRSVGGMGARASRAVQHRRRHIARGHRRRVDGCARRDAGSAVDRRERSDQCQFRRVVRGQLDAGGSAGLHTVAACGPGPDLRVSIAVAPSIRPSRTCSPRGGLLWRLDGAPLAATPVIRIRRTPRLTSTRKRSPCIPRPERIIFAGQNIVVDGAQCAAMYIGTVTGPVGGNFRFDFTSPAAHPERDDSFIGFGVHPDVHALRFVPIAGGGTQIWVACDGGIYRSTQGDADNRVVKRTFASQNDGLATLQTGYVATHPSVEGYLLTGAHDNGTLERVGDTVWRARFRGDGGGVIFNPLAPERFFYQNTETDWNDDGKRRVHAAGPSIERRCDARHRGEQRERATRISTAAATRFWWRARPRRAGRGWRSEPFACGCPKTGARRGARCRRSPIRWRSRRSRRTRTPACSSAARPASAAHARVPVGVADAAVRAVQPRGLSSSISWPTPACPAASRDKTELTRQATHRVRIVRHRRRGVARTGAAGDRQLE